MATSSPDKNIGLPKGNESLPARVSQTMKLDLSTQLGGILEEVNRISEQASENAKEDWSSTKATATQQGSAGQASSSQRQQAIASIPEPPIMQKQLEKHIRAEVKKLRRQAKTISRISHPGAAHRLNQLYAHIRRLNALLSELVEASYEALKRLFIRVFIDKQPIL